MLADRLAQQVEPAHRALAARQDGQHLGRSRQVQPHHHAGIGLAHQEAAAVRGQAADQRQLMRGQAEAVAIILRPRPRIGHEHQRRGLFDQGGRDPAVERVARALGGEADQRVALPQRLQPVADARGEHLVVERLPALVDQDHRRLPVQPLLDAVEQIHHRRRPQPRAVEQRGHVEAQHARAKVEPVGGIVEQPAMLAILDPRAQPVGEVARLRPPRARQQLAEPAQPAQAGIVAIGGIDRAGDGRQLLRPGGLQQHRQPVAQEGAVERIVGQRQRVEAGRLARADAVIPPADAADEQLGPAILVEQDRAGGEFLRLGGEEVHHHRLARTGRADDREIAQVAMVEVEEERRRAGGFQQAHRIAPMVALGLPQGKAVERAEAGHVGAGDQRPAHQEMLVAGELAPEGRLQIGVLAHRDGAGIGQRGGDGGGRIVEPGKVALAHQHGQVMVAEDDRPAAQPVARGQHVGPLGSGLLVGGAQPAQRQVDPLARGLALLRGEAFRHDHLERQPQHPVEQARRGRVGIVLEAQHGREIGPVGPGGAAQLHRIEPEAGPAIGHHPADIGVGFGPPHGPHLAIIERAQQLQQLVVGGAAGAGIIAQRLRPVLAQGGGQRLHRRAQRAHVLGIGLDLLAPAPPHQLAGALRQPGLAARRAPHQRHELVVDEQRPARQLAAPAAVDMGRQRIVEAGRQLHRHPAADDVVIEHEARIEARPQHHLASRRMGVQRVGVLGLEQQAGHLQRGHQRSVAQQQRVRIDQPGIGQAVAGMRFLRAPRGGTQPLGLHLLAPCLSGGVPRGAAQLRRCSCCSPTASSS